ncbi:50S ribosomal protein L3 [Patescibacteria group bacterium]|nr:50S ribosomal protein L3 [Patescibacteria group bacterium]
MKFILGKKIEMSQIFKGDKVIPVTKIQAGPCLITQIKTQEKDGYEAIQIGFAKKRKNTKSLLGHLKKGLADKEYNRYLKEFKTERGDLKIGDKIKVDIFQPGDKIKIVGTSKGKGFQGVVKRHGFHGASATHGTKDQERMPGSIGATGPARVFKGKKMPGRMGGKQVTVKILEIIEVNPEENLLLVKGSVPGARNSLLEITQVKY